MEAAGAGNVQMDVRALAEVFGEVLGQQLQAARAAPGLGAGGGHNAAEQLARVRDLRYDRVRKSTHRAGSFDCGENFRSYKVQFMNFLQFAGCRDQINGQEIFEADFLASLLLATMQGKAAERTTQLQPNTPAYNATIHDGNTPREWDRFMNYFRRVEELFLPREESDMAKQNFRDRKQSIKEDSASYGQDKIALFHLAYSDEQANQMFSFLKDEYISGIYNPVVKRRLVESNINTEEDLRLRTIQLVAEERKKYLVYHCSDSTSLDGLLSTSRAAYTGGPESMELDQLQKLQGAGPCYRCGKQGHTARECRANWDTISGKGDKKSAQSGRFGGGRDNKSSGNSNSGKTDKSNAECRYCHKIGHWIADCRKRKADEKKKAAGAGRGGGGSRGGRGGGGGRGRRPGHSRSGSHKQIGAEETDDDGPAFHDGPEPFLEEEEE